MSDLEFIAPVKTTTVTFRLEPVHNVISYLVLLENVPEAEFSTWAKETYERLTPEQRQINKRVNLLIGYYFENRQWESFPVWLDDLASRDPIEVREQALEYCVENAKKMLEADAVPTAESILEDPAVFIRLMRGFCQVKGKECIEEEVLQEYELFRDPAPTHKLVVDHLRLMWDEYLKSRWEEDLPLLHETIRAFETIDFGKKPPSEILYEVANREVPEAWGEMLEEAKEIVFVPSAHIGPYLIGYSLDEIVRISFGARMPKGVSIQSPALARSDLITRMSALADDTRLRILQLVAGEGKQGSKDIIARLKLSQSAASRHLRQLVATGYLVEEREEGSKVYRLNANRLEEAFSAMKEFLG